MMESTVHLNVYTEKALKLLKKNFTDSREYAHPDHFMQDSDNEVIYINFPGCGEAFLISKKKIIERLLVKTIDGQFGSPELQILANVISGSKEDIDYVIKKFGKKAVDEIIGKPLDPFKANAIEVLHQKVLDVRKEYDLKISKLEAEKNKIVDDLKKQIEDLRKENEQKA